MKTKVILDQLAIIESQRENLLKELEVKRSNQTIKCGCGRSHKIKDCHLIQTHWYERPHGCSGGDTWHQGEMQFVCPDTDNKNRLYFPQNDIPYEKRGDFKYSAEQQFQRIFKRLFKSVTEDYDTDKRKWWLNEWINNHHEQYGIKIG